MSQVIGPFQIGPHLIGLQLQGGLLDTAGNFTVQATYDLLDVVLGSGMQPQTRTANIKPVTEFNMNHVPVEFGGFAQLRCLKHSANFSKLEKIKNLHSHCVLTRLTGRDQYIGSFTIANGDFPHEGQEGQIATLELEPCKFKNEA